MLIKSFTAGLAENWVKLSYFSVLQVILAQCMF